MSKYDIVLTLFTIVYGLMLTDLFFSLHKLIRRRKTVQWHWLPLLVTWYLFLIILKNWWDLAFFQNSTEWMNILFFLAYGHLLVLIFLSVSTVLPDDIQQNGINLKDYYFKNHRYFWGLMTSVVVVSIFIRYFKLLILGEAFNFLIIITNGIFILLILILAISKKYWVHATIVSFLVLAIIFEIVHK